MANSQFSVFLVDDDASILRSLARLLISEGYRTETFSSAREFLEAHNPSVPGCAVIDLAMPEVDGLTLQNTLAAKGVERPIIFLSGRGSIPVSVKAMQAGAIDFLEKPVQSERLLSAIERAASRDAAARERSGEKHAIASRINLLTPREFEVLGYVIAGQLNKQIAHALGSAEKTVKVHRGRVMKKLGVHTVAELVRLTEKMNIRPNLSQVTADKIARMPQPATAVKTS
jgi:FixJ family two-component response regulator